MSANRADWNLDGEDEILPHGGPGPWNWGLLRAFGGAMAPKFGVPQSRRALALPYPGPRRTKGGPSPQCGGRWLGLELIGCPAGPFRGKPHWNCSWARAHYGLKPIGIARGQGPWGFSSPSRCILGINPRGQGP